MKNKNQEKIPLTDLLLIYLMSLVATHFIFLSVVSFLVWESYFIPSFAEWRVSSRLLYLFNMVVWPAWVTWGYKLER